MAQEVVKQENFNVGEIDPRAADRSDLKVYYAALELAENLSPLPVGPIVRRPGLPFVDYVRHKLAEVPVTGGMITAPSGGTVADAVSADGTWFTTTADMGASDYVVLAIDFGEPEAVSVIDLIDFAAKAPAAPGDPAPPPFTYPWPDLGGDINLGFLGDHLGPEIP